MGGKVFLNAGLLAGPFGSLLVFPVKSYLGKSITGVAHKISSLLESNHNDSLLSRYTIATLFNC